MDTFLSLFSIIAAYFLTLNNSNISPNIRESITYGTVLVLAIRSVSFFISKIYAGIVRHTTTKDLLRIGFAIGFGTLALLFIRLVAVLLNKDLYFLPISTIFVDFFLLTSLLSSVRVFAKGLYWKYLNNSESRQRVIILGGLSSGLLIKQTLERDMHISVDPVAFLVNNKSDVKKEIDGTPVYHYSAFADIVQKEHINLFLLADGEIDDTTKTALVNEAIQRDIKVLSVPKSTDWVNGQLSYKQLKRIRVEDLLGRPPILLDNKNIEAQVFDKTVMVTGAAGSIGSEIVRQMTHYSPKLIVLVDQAESPLYDMELELLEDMQFEHFKIIIMSITNEQRVRSIFERFQPEIVYHAAAYKHVPMMERHPREAIFNNVNGSRILANFAHQYEVEKFVMVSTDKAVNPTNVMGASKRIAEIYIQALSENSQTKFITTRFGNVLGSNGSVIPRFKKQIEHGGPVTVTHENITRYFMTIPEACQLVLEAGAMGKGGEIFVFDMGQPIKIADFARKMIKLSGMTEGKDIELEFTGLRPGEKLYEELLSSEEDCVPTHHKRIMIAKVRKYDFQEVSKQLDRLEELNQHTDHFAIVGQMKVIVPEFISQNSTFCSLDRDCDKDE